MQNESDADMNVMNQSDWNKDQRTGRIEKISDGFQRFEKISDISDISDIVTHKTKP